ncbi:MAG: YjeJ family protein [Scandinavium sp.]|uniref:YjeJ family protein n=1 Tax=Scandinavium sp. TaxID=2830653 RepID=UPI003F406A28
MTSTITGINTGIIRHAQQFQALALKIKHQHGQESLVFIPALPLRDLYIWLEHRLYLQSQRNAKDKATFKTRQHVATQALHHNIPELNQKHMLHADIRQRVTGFAPGEAKQQGSELVFSLEGENRLTVLIDDTQIALLISAISHAINNAGMHELSLRIASLLDFLPMYDADMKENGEMEYDTYQHAAWKIELFTHYLALVYHFTDENGQPQACGTIVKSRVRGDMKDAQAVAQRLLAFSPRLKKLEGKPCRISVATLASGKGLLSQQHGLRALYQLCQKTLLAPATAE